MKKFNFTTTELAVLAGVQKDSYISQKIKIEAKKTLGLSVSTKYDTTAENFAKRIIYYIRKNNADVRETLMTGKWLKMLAKRIKIFLKVNGLKPTDNLAISLAYNKAEGFKLLHPNYTKVNQLYRGIEAFIEDKFPSEDTLKGKTINTIYNVLDGIDGRFGRRILKPKFRCCWRILTYGTLIALFLIYVFIPLMDYWQEIVDYINSVRWYN